MNDLKKLDLKIHQGIESIGLLYYIYVMMMMMINLQRQHDIIVKARIVRVRRSRSSIYKKRVFESSFHAFKTLFKPLEDS